MWSSLSDAANLLEDEPIAFVKALDSYVFVKELDALDENPSDRDLLDESSLLFASLHVSPLNETRLYVFDREVLFWDRVSLDLAFTMPVPRSEITESESAASKLYTVAIGNCENKEIFVAPPDSVVNFEDAFDAAGAATGGGLLAGSSVEAVFR